MKQKLAADNFSFRNCSFKWSSKVTYLGVDLDQRLSFKTHIERVVNRARSVVSSLYCLFRKNNSVSFHAKLTAYKTLIKPIMTYACPIFSNCPVIHFKKLQIQQNQMLRMVLNAPFFTRTTDLHEQANDIPTVRQFVDKLTRQFYSRASSHDNKLVKNLGKYDIHNMGFRLSLGLELGLNVSLLSTQVLVRFFRIFLTLHHFRKTHQRFPVLS
ncbi:CLUMA_CG014497, isoform A [Clunio marinus]|uniref:CLUMA_CG014497, isoform A n=1 Tax=Clunio marinus TaxID=568069 RepID=A0A1J1IMQ9_9DIPT|nr:CLUMA_CG014497, isoform A [Clunio marinus]